MTMLSCSTINNPCPDFKRINASNISRGEYKPFKKLILDALSYHHDEDKSSIALQAIRKNFDKLLEKGLINDEIRQLAEAYHNGDDLNSFDRLRLIHQLLYLERTQIDKLISDIQECNLILLKGLVGEGKSCIMFKLFKYLEECKTTAYFPIYIDLKKKTEHYSAMSGHSSDVHNNLYRRNSRLDSIFEESIVKTILLTIDEFIDRNKLLPSALGDAQQFRNAILFDYCNILHSDHATAFKSFVFNRYKVNIGSVSTFFKNSDLNQIENTIEAFKQQYTNRTGLEFTSQRTLEGYLEFFYILGKSPVFLIDNLDRLPLYRQQQLLDLAIDWRTILITAPSQFWRCVNKTSRASISALVVQTG